MVKELDEDDTAPNAEIPADIMQQLRDESYKLAQQCSVASTLLTNVEVQIHAVMKIRRCDIWRPCGMNELQFQNEEMFETASRLRALIEELSA